MMHLCTKTFSKYTSQAGSYGLVLALIMRCSFVAADPMACITRGAVIAKQLDYYDIKLDGVF